MASQPYAAEPDVPERERPVGRSRGRGACGRDPIYLFACHLEWRDRGNLRAYDELIAALDDVDPNIRYLAEALLHRSSPHPKSKTLTTATKHPHEEYHAGRHR